MDTCGHKQHNIKDYWRGNIATACKIWANCVGVLILPVTTLRSWTTKDPDNVWKAILLLYLKVAQRVHHLAYIVAANVDVT